MTRPQDDSPLSQWMKYEAHKKANATIKHYLKKKDYIAAYVIAFSMFEDRVRAFDVVVQRDLKANEQWKLRLGTSLTPIVAQLKDGKYLSRETAKCCFSVNGKRNKLLHEAMWKLDVFNADDVAEVLQVREMVRSELAKLKRDLRKAAKQSAA